MMSAGFLFDPGLTPAETVAIRRALLTEKNPSHLIGFASCLSPYFPVAASLLYARSQLLELREQSHQRDLAADGRGALDELRTLIDRESRGAWSGASATDWILQPIDTASNLSRFTLRATGGTWSDVAKSWAAVSPPPVPWPRLDRMRAAAEGLATLRQSDPRLQQIGRSLCQPTRERSFAATLQAAGFHEHFSATRGASLLARMDDLIAAGTRAARNGTDVRSELLARRRTEVPRELRHDAASLASELCVSPNATADGVPSVVAALARAATVEVGPGIWIVDPRLHAPNAIPIAHQADWGEIAAERARWVDWHARAARATSG